MNNRQSIVDVFTSIEEMNSEKFVSYLSGGIWLRFGNDEPVTGQDSVGKFMREFFSKLDSIKHTIGNIWQNGSDAIINGSVEFTRRSGSKLTVPFCNVFRYKETKIHKFQVYIDISGLNGEKAG